MTIGIDVDDTITKTTETLNSLPWMTKDFFDKAINDPSSIPDFNQKLNIIFSNLKTFDNAIEVINSWKNSGKKVVVITARGSLGLDALVSITRDYFKANKIDVDDIIFYQEKKGEACKNNGVDIFIDDNEKVLDEVKSKGIKTIRFCSKKVLSNHKVLHSWLELKEYIARLGDNDGKNN